MRTFAKIQIWIILSYIIKFVEFNNCIGFNKF